jgi:plastocyanin
VFLIVVIYNLYKLTMKTIRLVSVVLLLMISVKSYSVVHTINVAGMSFTPSTLNVNVGDVIHWVWLNGTHTTSSRTIPIGAASWDSPLTSSQTTFDYTVTVAGTYNYACNIHESMGMVGSFTAIAATGVGENSLPKEFAVYPNPATSILNISAGVIGELVVSDVLGKSIKQINTNELISSNNAFQLNVSDLENGIYIISLIPADNKKRISIKFIKN